MTRLRPKDASPRLSKWTVRDGLAFLDAEGRILPGISKLHGVGVSTLRRSYDTNETASELVVSNATALQVNAAAESDHGCRTNG